MDSMIATPTSAKKGPRAADTYRAHRRNTWKAERRLPEWREMAADIANRRANIEGRQVIANGAREAAAKTIVEENIRPTGLRRDVIAASAMLEHYRGCKRTRSVNRIIRSLEKQIAS